MNNNQVSKYLEEINKINIPENEIDILDFLGELKGREQENFLSFILSQSHLYKPMTAIFENYFNNDFYSSAGYADRLSQGKIVPKINQDGKVYYEEWASSDDINKGCKNVLNSLQSDNKGKWNRFVDYIKSIYQPDKMDIYYNCDLSQLNENIMDDFINLSYDIVENDRFKDKIQEIQSKPIIQGKNIYDKIKNFFVTRRKMKEIHKIEGQIKEDDDFQRKAIELIEKYQENNDVSTITKRQMDLAKRLIQAGIPKDIFIIILNGLAHGNGESSLTNHYIFDMLKDLKNNALIAKELYLPEMLNAKNIQDICKNIRLLFSQHPLENDAPLTCEYRQTPLGNRLNPSEDISNILKGKNLTYNQIEESMKDLDSEFEIALETTNAEDYVRKCTDILMKFISIHPYNDGNGRTSRLLMQTMLAKRGILMPSTIDNYFERLETTQYSQIEYEALKTDDYKLMEDYMINRAKRFNNGELILDDTPVIRQTKQLRKENVQDIEK